MKTVHTTTIVGKCPTGCPDVYEAEFHVRDMVIPVESIQLVIQTATKDPIYQEDLTKTLADALDCTVVTTGIHGSFRTRCECEPPRKG